MNDTWYKCTICGNEGTVGRCCGKETRVPLNAAATYETVLHHKPCGRKTAMGEKTKQKVFVPRYSGNKSREFWRNINAIKGNDRWVAYSLGVALQNIEQQLLHILNGGIKIVVKREDSDGSE